MSRTRRKKKATLWTSWRSWQESAGSATDNSYKSWRAQDRAIKGQRCPKCNKKHYWTRIDRINLAERGEVRIECQCGQLYWIVMNGSMEYRKTNRVAEW